jgi:hypothetical protein
MSKKTSTRRRVLKTLGAGAAVGQFAGITAASERSDANPSFDPSDLSEVTEFVNTTFNVEQGRIEATEHLKPVAGDLSARQEAAIEDAMQPSVFESISVPSGQGAEAATVEREFLGEDLTEKWGWDVSPYLDTPQVSVTDREAQSDTVKAYALSVDYTGYRWRCEIQWDHDGSSVSNTFAGDTVLYSNYAVDYKGADEDVFDDTSTYDVEQQATFDNSLGEYCAFGLCIELASTFNPYIRLRGYADGDGETVYKGDDAWT